MNNRICLINQPAGIGDILYTLKIGQVFYKNGYHVIWPIIRQYSWLPDYLNLVPFDFPVFDNIRDQYILDLFNSSTAEVIETGDLVYLPLRRSTLNSLGSKHQLMFSKYAMVNLGHLCRHWYHAIQITRNYDRECCVLQHYGLSASTDFIFVNSKIGSPDGHLHELAAMSSIIEKLNFYSPYPIIENQFIHGTTLFDFIQILCLAREVHLPNSVFAWLVEYLRFCGLTRPDQKRVCYPRDRGNPINDNWNYIKNCWDESQWFFYPPL